MSRKFMTRITDTIVNTKVEDLKRPDFSYDLNNWEKEYWAWVLGYEGRYMVSTWGRVVSMITKNTIYNYPHELAQSYTTDGYRRVGLHGKDGTDRYFSVHRLVATAFIPNPNRYPQINHMDEIVDNNCVWNLEWCTKLYNMNYGARVDRCAITRCLNNDRKIYMFDKDGVLEKSFMCLADASFHICGDREKCSGNISSACEGNIQYTYGHFWSYNEKLDPEKIVKMRYSKFSEKGIYQFDESGRCIARFDNYDDAAESLINEGYSINGSSAHIAACCRGELNSFGKYYWSNKPEINIADYKVLINQKNVYIYDCNHKLKEVYTSLTKCDNNTIYSRGSLTRRAKDGKPLSDGCYVSLTPLNKGDEDIIPVE